jgi:hypothetical protein
MMTRRGFAGMLAAEMLSGWSADQTTFDFHSGFWVNLHFVLYNMAAGKKDGREPNLSALNPAETAVWNDALRYYEANMIGHAFGELPMIKLNQGFAKGVPSPILEPAASIYRAHWWTEHDRKNREWIDEVTPLVAAHEDFLRTALARAYDMPWPKQRVHVEVSYYLTGASGYTSLRPTLTTVSSWSKRNAGAAGVETLFHEAGHAQMTRVQQAMKRVNRRPAHDDLWHALMFYTTGELVRKCLPEVEPYAIKYGLWEQGWRGVYDVMVRHWKPFLDGQGTFREAIEGVVRGDSA